MNVHKNVVSQFQLGVHRFRVTSNRYNLRSHGMTERQGMGLKLLKFLCGKVLEVGTEQGKGIRV